MSMYPPFAPWTYPDERYYYGWYDELPPERPPSDHDIKSALVKQLQENPHTAGHDLRVDVKDGVVILLGQVNDARAKRAAGDDAWDTQGVTDVSNQLMVVAPTP